MNIHDLISQYLDGELSSEAEAELHHRLSVSPGDRKLFREQILLRATAGDPRVLDRPSPAARAALFARLQREEGFRGIAPPQRAFGAQDAPPVPPTATGRAASATRRRRRLVPMLLPLIIGLIGAGLVWQLEMGDGSKSGGEEFGDGRPMAAAAPETLSAPEALEEDGSQAGTETGSTSSAAAATESAQAAADLPAPTERRAVGGTGSASGTGERDRIDDRLAIATEPESPRGFGEMTDGGIGRTRREGARPAAPQMMISAPSGSDGEMAAGDFDAEEARTERGASEGQAPEENPLDVVPSMPITSRALAESAVPPSTQAAAPMGPSQGAGRMGSDKGGLAPLGVAASAAKTVDKTDDGARDASDSNELRSDPRDSRPLAVAVSPAQSRRFALLTNLQQNLMVGLKDNELRGALAVRVGGALSDGAHEVFGVLGYSSYSQTTLSETVTNQRDTMRAGLGSSSHSDVLSSSSRRPELWVGAGYRFNAIHSRSWLVGATGWGGIGERNVRVGAELPIAYRLGRAVRIELIPSVQYVTVRGATVQNTRDVTLSSDAEKISTSTEEVTSSGIQAGVGVGVTVVVE